MQPHTRAASIRHVSLQVAASVFTWTKAHQEALPSSQTGDMQGEDIRRIESIFVAA